MLISKLQFSIGCLQCKVVCNLGGYIIEEATSSYIMTYKKLSKLKDAGSKLTPVGTKGEVRKSLNNEHTWTTRDCQETIAENNRQDSGKRCDVPQTTDKNAYCDMFEYIKSDTKTLDTHRDSRVANFYAGRSIFITGASGFLGKCLLEKLLRSCPDLKRVYILMRPKRELGVAERVEALIMSQLFERLRNSINSQEQINKIVAVKGDITEPFFGLSDKDIETLSSEVSLVFHSAATVKFAEPLKRAVENNVSSVDNLINLASKMHKLDALVHVSTAYSNCDRNVVDEIFYDPPIEADKLIDMSHWMNNNTLDEISPVLLGKRPNTYTFTKAVAESLLMERTKKLLPNIPIAMIRPSIVAGIWSQPICGWVDNFNGPTGVILSMMVGAIQGMIGVSDYCADIVPVDIVANLIICTAWQVYEQQNGPSKKSTDIAILERSQHNKNITIFNCVSGTLNPVFWGDISKYSKQIGLVYPCNNIMRLPGTMLVSNEFIFKVYFFINHTLPAYVGDCLLKLAGKKPKLTIINNRMRKMIDTLKPFTSNQWVFKCSNVTHLYERLNPIDKELFNFDIRQVRWDDYIRRYYVGSKIFALKDDPKQVICARQKLNRMRLGNRLAQTLFIILVYYFLISGTSIEKTAINSMMKVVTSLIRSA